jgi:hypothetical protein
MKAVEASGFFVGRFAPFAERLMSDVVHNISRHENNSTFSKGFLMKTLTPKFPLLFVLLMSAGLAQSELWAVDEKAPPVPAVVEGVIKAVDPANNAFILTLPGEKKIPVKPESANDIKIMVDLKTSYWLDGKPATMDQAMKVGNTASVTHINGLALKVQVKSKPA